MYAPTKEPADLYEHTPSAQAELPIQENENELPQTPDYSDAAFRKLLGVEEELADRGVLEMAEPAELQEGFDEHAKLFELEQGAELALAELTKMQEVGEVLDLPEDAAKPYEEKLERQEEKARRFRRQLLEIDQLEGGENQVTKPMVYQELTERLETFELSLRKEREKAVMRFIVDSTEMGLESLSSELDRCENAAKARQAIVFTLYHGIMQQAQRFIKEGGEPDYSFCLQFELVEHPAPEGGTVLYFSDIHLDFDYGKSYELPEEAK